MTAIQIMLAAALALLGVTVALLVALLRRKGGAEGAALEARLEGFERAQERMERTVKEEAGRGREEMARGAREQRAELAEAFERLGEAMGQRAAEGAAAQEKRLREFSEQLTAFAKASGERLDALRTEEGESARKLRAEVRDTLGKLHEMTRGMLSEMATAQKAQLEGVSAAVARLTDSNEKKLEAVRVTVEGRLQSLQADNAKQIEMMRQTVDEKLQSTLERRLDASFKLVSDRLEQVQKGLGEMQTLATGVGDLKKVLSNVKSRGTWGEIQLGTMLEQVLTPEQYGSNVATRGTGERVEFAIRLPGPGERDEPVWLPIDAKFPLEDYQRLTDAQEQADAARAEQEGRALEARVRQCARDIREKYVEPPKTTDFAILFLPVEGLFAEVVRRPGLTDALQREQHVVVAGPTTLWALLNSLQMGFRTLAIQKRSSEVWRLLAAVKTEWSKYGEALDLVHRKLHQASESVEKARVRTRAVGRKLKGVEELTPGASLAALSLPPPEEDLDENEGPPETPDAGEEPHQVRGLPRHPRGT